MLILILIVSLFQNTQAQVSQKEINTDGSGEKAFFKNTYLLSLERTKWAYEETDNDGKQFMQDSGSLTGIRLSADSTAGDSSFYLGGHAAYLSGKTKYDGQLQNGTPHQSDSQNSILDLEIRSGMVGSLTASSAIIPYLGLNYWQLNNPEQANDNSDYSRKINYLSVPLGLSSRALFGQDSMFILDASYYYFIKGTVESKFSDISPGVTDAVNKQKKGRGQKLVATYAAGNMIASCSLGFSIIYQNWKISESDKAQFTETSGGKTRYWTAVEPSNTTQMLGLSVNLGF